MIERLLIANRGEIAVRVARGAREMGIVPLGIYSEADANAYHLRFMEDARCVGPAPAAESYLNGEAIIAAAIEMRADAVHPVTAFFRSVRRLRESVRDAGLIFVGSVAGSDGRNGQQDRSEAARARGRRADGSRLRRRRSNAPSDCAKRPQRIGFPLLIKASAGGGGRGMRVVESLEAFRRVARERQREALAAFGDDAVLLERYLRDPRHIEFQILADAHGTTLYLGERECSIQRRHQKIVEEAPSVALNAEAARAQWARQRCAPPSRSGYVNAGTAEFMLDADGEFYFLEMNARLQVEHPVTELVYGVDLVQWQLRIAAGERLTLAQADLQPRGWAIEARLYAEDPANDMLPSTGTITHVVAARRARAFASTPA